MDADIDILHEAIFRQAVRDVERVRDTTAPPPLLTCPAPGDVTGGGDRHTGTRGGNDGGRPDNIAGEGASLAGGAADPAWPLEEMKISTCECAEGTGRAAGQPCSSEPVVQTIMDFVRDVVAPAHAAGRPADVEIVKEGVGEGTLPDGASTGAKAVRVAASVLGCSSESCVLSHPNFVTFARKKGVARRIEADKELRFKAAGPRNSRALLNNFNIDETLQRWARAFPELYVHPFAMSDFDQTHENLDIIDPADIVEGDADLDLGAGVGIVRRPAACIACVLNTDTSRGGGKHWVAAFVDARGRGAAAWTVEFFNSAGRPPFASIARWMEKARSNLSRLRAEKPEKYGTGPVNAVAVTDVDHQNSQTECGPYSLAYIRARLEGKPIAFFQGDRIPDETMTEFRKHLFRESR